MLELNKEEMLQVNGGAIKWGLLAGIGALASFVVGVIDGWINPLKCNN